MNKKPLIICILAAGKGARMESDLPKVLHKVDGKPMITEVINTAKKLNPKKIIVIVGYKKEKVIEETKEYNVDYVIQDVQNGTAHAVMQCKSILEKVNGNLLVLSGDVPLITENTLKKLINLHIQNNSMGTLLSTIIKNPYGYGRIVRDHKNRFIKIVEEKDTNIDEKNIQEIISGIYIFDIKKLFEKIPLINNNNNQNEYYLTDVFNFIKKNISIMLTQNSKEISGINTIDQLEEINEN